MKPYNESFDLTEEKSLKTGSWKNIRQSRFKTVVFALLLALGSAQLAQAQLICRVALSGEDYAQDLAKLVDRYKAIDSAIVDSEKQTYQNYVDRYQSNVVKHGPFWGVHILNHREFADKMTEKMLLLWKREPSPKALAKIEVALDKIDKQSKKISHWAEIKKSDKALSLLQESGPKIDKLNVKKKNEIENWHGAMDVVMKLAQSKNHLTEESFAEIALALQGLRGQASWSTARLISNDYISFMYTKDSRNRQVLDPVNTFIPGTHKRDSVKYLLNWLRNNRSEIHPVILAAKVRQMIVSIHPLEDGNGRLARLVANYVLMQAGLPPAMIPRGTEQQNSSVALFPLKSFKDQISPEESVQIMIDGVLRSQQHLMR